MSRVTTEFAPITARSPIVTPPVTTQLTPNQQFDPIETGPRVEPLPGDRHVGVVVAVVAVADEAAVGEHHVVADLDPLDGGEHHVTVEEAAVADLDLGAARDIVIQQPGSNRVPSPTLTPPLVEPVEHLALDGMAHEEAAVGGVRG